MEREKGGGGLPRKLRSVEEVVAAGWLDLVPRKEENVSVEGGCNGLGIASCLPPLAGWSQRCRLQTQPAGVVPLLLEGGGVKETQAEVSTRKLFDVASAADRFLTRYLLDLHLPPEIEDTQTPGFRSSRLRPEEAPTYSTL